ncbi:MAG: thioredoxin domain-containing protein [Gemmatimonadaceae bacterium]
MPRISLQIIALAALVAACKQPDNQPDKQPDTRTASAAATATTTAATAAGNVAPGAVANDTISDRADRGRLLGDTNAKVWVIMASDFQCPFCKQWHDNAFQGLLKNYVNTGKVRLAFLNVPLSIHPNAVPASEAAMCASIQDKFWPVHEALFATQKDWENLANPDSALTAIVKKTGVDVGKWTPCYKGHLTRPLIQADHDRAIQQHVNSTPTFFIGDQVLAGADVDVPAAIEAALKARAKKPGN